MRPRHTLVTTALSLALLCGIATAAPEDDAPTSQDVPPSWHAHELSPQAPPAEPVAEPAPFGERVRHRASDMVLKAMNFLGVAYRRGGSSEQSGFDCSGFTRHIVQASFGLLLPRRADEQATAPGLRTVQREELQPGDLVFFNTRRRTFSHVGMYVGNGKFIHSPRAGGRVRIEDMAFAYWRKRFTGARRVEAPGDRHGTAPATEATRLPQPDL